MSADHPRYTRRKRSAIGRASSGVTRLQLLGNHSSFDQFLLRQHQTTAMPLAPLQWIPPGVTTFPLMNLLGYLSRKLPGGHTVESWPFTRLRMWASKFGNDPATQPKSSNGESIEIVSITIASHAVHGWNTVGVVGHTFVPAIV